MSAITLNGSNIGNALMTILNSADIQPGDQPSYELCKTIYLYHPLGAKMAEKPVRMAMSQPREISVPDSPEEIVKKRFEEQWQRDQMDRWIFATRVQSRIYGISSCAILEEGKKTNDPVDYWNLHNAKITFNVYDPLNTAGSLIFNQDPLSMSFQHAQEITVNSSQFHRSRARVILNEFPIYLSYTSSAFGFSGRSVYQRSLYPLKSFIQTMRTNDMIARKAGVIVAKIKQIGAVVTNAMMTMVGLKRNVVKEAEIDNVISIGTDGDAIESLDLKNLDGPFKIARENIVQDIASGAPMPAKLLTEESFAQGFADGTEDAKEIARFIEEERTNMAPIYEWADKICMHRAWTPEWYRDVIQKNHSEYSGVDYKAAFMKWEESFSAPWPSLLIEPESEQVRVHDVKLRALVAVLQALAPELPRDQMAKVIEWVADNINEMRIMFGNPLELDYTEIADFDPKEQSEELEDGEPPTNFRLHAADSADKAIDALKHASDALASLDEDRRRRLREKLLKRAA